jgi:hypothetical protein
MSRTNESIKSIEALNGFHFSVEAYQRGYKWGILQVHELLSDIDEFERGFESFYCLQPVVVKDLGEHKYELIDGQQRLTTIFILLKCLNLDIYKLSYRTREESEHFLEHIDKELAMISLDLGAYDVLEPKLLEEEIMPVLQEHWGAYVEQHPDHDNVDNYHFYTAYQYIKNWLALKGKGEDSFKQKLLSDSKVIWYEQTGEDSAEEIFVKFNHGKIGLAQAELIKALFVLQIQEEKNIELRSFKLNQFAEEWNTIENQLQDNAFWFFVSNDISDARKANRIDFIFDLLAEKPSQSNDNLHSYHHYLRLYKEHKEKDTRPLLNWAEVRDLYHQIYEWYTNRDLYHLIGYLVHEGIADIIKVMAIFQTSKTKQEFEGELKQKIWNCFFEIDKDKYALEELIYGKDNERIESILVLHNIINYHFTDAYYRFPFDRLKQEKGWSLEHIHAQNTDNFKTIDDIRHWIKDIRDLAEDFKEDVSFNEASLERLEEKLGASNISKTNPEIKNLVLKLDEDATVYFDKNSLNNLCLLDRKTNSSIGNKFFAEKRKAILDIDKMTLGEYNKRFHKQEQTKPYIPLATKHVFLKYYAEEGAVSMTFWGSKDRKGYFEHIESGIKEYLNRKERTI